METKVCSKCNTEKPIDEFPKRHGKHSHLVRGTCRRCYYDGRNASTKRRWETLAQNLKRHSRHGLSAKQISEMVGEPEECYLCGDQIDGWKDAELDHVVPVSLGGETSKDNLKWAHKTCNRIKHDLMVDDLITHMQKMIAHLSKGRN